ncbi:MAG: Gfo/Idh/MocA family oxidoreductase [Gemmatimonadota bacterium]|nr:Gfo/Idh/MocA family oxidoreductase [Gemmatimonadota bacterium]
MNVVIIGASGIGKHHAKWFHLEGCHVTAFSGTSDASCRKTGQTLTDLFGFQGRTYTDYRRMLDFEKPDIVCICSPNEVHLEQTRYALEIDSHVYCEKPVAWPDLATCKLSSHPPSESPEVTHPILRQTLDETRSVVALADQRNLLFGMNAQYVASREAYQTIYEKHNGPMDDIESFYFLLESKGVSGNYSSYEGIWIDMAPHALSQIIALMPPGNLDMSHMDCRVKEDNTVARFRYGSGSIEAKVSKNAESDMKRKFGVNGFLVDYYGQPDDQGVYWAFLRHGDDIIKTVDFMQLSVRRYIKSVRSGGTTPFVDGHAAVKNLEMSMIILEHAHADNRLTLKE